MMGNGPPLTRKRASQKGEQQMLVGPVFLAELLLGVVVDFLVYGESSYGSVDAEGKQLCPLK